MKPQRKTAMKTVRMLQILGGGILALPLNACSVQRSEVMMCGFADGSDVKLKATHDWSPLGALLSKVGDVRTRSDQQGYVAYFRLENGEASEAPGGPGYMTPSEDPARKHLAGDAVCSKVAKWHGRPMINRSFLQNDGRWFDGGQVIPIISAYHELMPKWIEVSLRKMNGSPIWSGFSLIAPVDDSLVHEQPIGDVKEGFVIRAVYQTISKDAGKTWSSPTLTPHAYIFEIGRRVEDQSFVGRPISFEIQKLPARPFTKPQTPEEKGAAIRALPPEWRRVRSEADPGT